MNESRAVRGGARWALAALAVLTLAVISPSPSHGTPVPPYVFVLLDTSGSMSWAPPCTAAQYASFDCNSLCPTGNCYVPLQADDPASKFHQVKDALFSVVDGADDVLFGFATFNQDTLTVRAKHWLYWASDDGVMVPGYGRFPALGTTEVFGYLWSCDTGSNDHEIGCTPAKPADLNDPWELARVRRLPKAGMGFNQDVLFYIRQGTFIYRVRYQPLSGAPGAAAQVRVEIDRCQNSSCTSRLAIGATTVDWEPAAEFLSWDNAGPNPSRTNPELSYFAFATAPDASASNVCTGWDPNTDSAADLSSGYSLRWPTDSSDSRGPLFSLGDVLPWDWTNDHQEAILGRLAPSYVLNPSSTPDFRTSPYLRDLPDTGESFLRLEDEDARPLIAYGNTPHDAMLLSFRTWYAGCASGPCTPGRGWKSIAEVQDPDFLLRQKAVVVITDGDNTCSGDPCATAAALFTDEGIPTYVVAYGVEPSPALVLECMASEGGTYAPIYPRTRDELVSALAQILEHLSTE